MFDLSKMGKRFMNSGRKAEGMFMLILCMCRSHVRR